jgi:GntR family transcriptional regulator/MocR family aminotransferase
MDRATFDFEPDRSATAPLHGQLEAAVREAIGQGALPPGARLPASRPLAAAAGVSRGVVTEAYAQLAAEGWIEARHGSAPVVRAVPGPVRVRPAAPAQAHAPRLDLTATAPDLGRFPRRAWLAAHRRVLAELPDAALDYGERLGDPVLRAALAAHLARTRGAAAAPDRIVVTGGYTQALWLACRALAHRGVRRVAVEDPSLDEAWATIRSAGLEVVPIPVDGRGARVDTLDALGAGAALVTPSHQFPTGALLAPERRRALLRWATAGSRLVLEDDYDAEYRYDRAPVGTLQRLAPEHVVHLGSASKTLAPALRLGWMLAPRWLAEAAGEERWAIDSGGPVLIARTYAELLAGGELDRHLRRTRREYRARRDALVAGLARALPDARVEGVAAGLHLLLRLPPGTGEAAVVEALARRRVRVRGLASYRFAPRDGEPALVIGYGRLPEAAVPAAVEAITSCCSGARPSRSCAS